MIKMNSWQIFKRSALTIACSAALFTTSTMAQDLSFTGRITDASNTVYFEGAKVRIKELKLTAISARDGSFRFPQLPIGDYTMEISYLGVPTISKKISVTTATKQDQKFVIGGEEAAMDNIIVYGQRAGQAGAINRQKNADNLMSIVSADTIGQSPDQNAAEASAAFTRFINSARSGGRPFRRYSRYRS